MLTNDALILWLGGFLLAVSALLALIRIIMGPTVLDRVVASDVFLTTVVLVLGLEMIVNKHTNSIPVMIGVSATAALATITVSRYVRRSNRENTATADSDRAENSNYVQDRANLGAEYEAAAAGVGKPVSAAAESYREEK